MRDQQPRDKGQGAPGAGLPHHAEQSRVHAGPLDPGLFSGLLSLKKAF